MGKRKISFHWENYVALIALIVLAIVSAILNPAFTQASNIINVLRQVASPGTLAVGMMFVILTGYVDLSVGSVLALSGVTVALLNDKIGIIPSILIALIGAVLLGCFYGAIHNTLHVPPFIVTMAGMNILRGTAMKITNSTAISITNQKFLMLGTYKLPFVACVIVSVILLSAYTLIKRKKIFQSRKSIAGFVLTLAVIVVFLYLIWAVNGLSIQIVLFLSILGVAWFVLEHTIFGREVYAVGDNINASRLAGIKTDRTMTVVFIISSVCAAFAGVLTATRLASGVSTAGNGMELDAIAAVVVGGTSLSGGKGKITGTLLGVLLIGVLNNLLSLLGMTTDMQLICKGLVVLTAVMLDAKNNK